MTSRDLPHQPLLRRTLAATAASPENLVPPNIRNETRGGIILCLPAQCKASADSINLQTIETTTPTKNLTSPNQKLDNFPVNPPLKSATFLTTCHRCRDQNEYRSILFEQGLLCPKCRLPFVAMGIPAPNTDVLNSSHMSVPDPCPTRFAVSSDSRTAPVSSGDVLVKQGAPHKNTTTPFAASSSEVEIRQAMKKKRLRTKTPLAKSSNLSTKYKRDTMTSRDLPHQPLLQRTLAATAASPENLVPPNNQNRTRGGIILCLPAQRKASADTINQQSIATTMPTKNLTSPSQHLDNYAVNPPPKSVTFWTACLRCEYRSIFVKQETQCSKCRLPFVAMEVPASMGDVMNASHVSVPEPCPTRFAVSSDSRAAPVSSGGDAKVKHGALLRNTITSFTASNSEVEIKQAIEKRRRRTKSPLANSFYVGNTGVPFQSNLRTRPKELPRDVIRQMLMDKAMAEILRYLKD